MILGWILTLNPTTSSVNWFPQVVTLIFMTDSESSLLGSSNETILALYAFPADIYLLMQKKQSKRLPVSGTRKLLASGFCEFT